MLLVGISGKRGVGKDLLASYLNKKHGFINLPFAGELKEAVRQDFDLTLAHTDGELKESSTKYLKRITPDLAGALTVFEAWTPRQIMIEYGQFFRQFDSLWWVKKVFQKIDSLNSYKETANYPGELKVSISDVRFKNEADYIKQQGGIIVRLNRLKELNIYKGQLNDVSETDMDDYKGFDLELSEMKNMIPQQLEEFADVIMNYTQTKLLK
jgi:hypothetical protein